MRVIDHPMPNGGWLATFEDITEQRQTEQDRDRNREFLDQIIENVPVTIVVKDAVTRKFVLANRAAEVHSELRTATRLSVKRRTSCSRRRKPTS